MWHHQLQIHNSPHRPAGGSRRDRREAPLGIVSPIDHAVFYRDPTANPRAQQIRVFVTGTGDGELFHNGERVYAGPLPRSVFWPLTEGVHEFRLLQPESGESVMSRIEVR